MEENLEFCCDLEVIEQLDVEEKKEYALTILSTYEKGTLYGLGLNHRPKKLERRVKIMFEKKKKSVVVASFTGFTLLFVLGLASTMANQSSFKEEPEQNIPDGTIQNEATASEMTDEVSNIFDLQNRISDKIQDEFAVDSEVTIVDYHTSPNVLVFIDNSNTDNDLNGTEIEKLVSEMMSDRGIASIDIMYAVPMVSEEEGQGDWLSPEELGFEEIGSLSDGNYVLMDKTMEEMGITKDSNGGFSLTPINGITTSDQILWLEINGYSDFESELGSVEDDEGFKDFEEYHPETGELMTPTEWVLYHEEQAQLDFETNFDVYEYIETVSYVLALQQYLFTEEDWQIILETAKTRENFFFETEEEYRNYLEEQEIFLGGYDFDLEEIEEYGINFSRKTDETYEIEEGTFTHNGKTYPYKVTATRLMEEGEWELVVYTSDTEISFAEIMMAGVGLSSGISDYKYFQSRAVLVRSLDAENS